MANLLFPLQFERQYSGPLDISLVYNTTADRLSGLTDPLSYAGQIVTDLETDKAYQLNAAKDAWIELGASSELNTLILTNSANWNSAYAYVSANSVNLSASNITVGNDVTVAKT